MAQRIVLDELFLTVRIPRDLSDRQVAAIRRRLKRRDFLSQLRRTVRGLVSSFPELAAVSVMVSR
jgi:hypothetical protein